jgi:hypothetical protein
MQSDREDPNLIRCIREGIAEAQMDRARLRINRTEDRWATVDTNGTWLMKLVLLDNA